MRTKTVIETTGAPRLRIRVDGSTLYEVKADGKWFEIGRDAYLAIVATMAIRKSGRP